MRRFVLASGSPQRLAVLRQVGLEPEVVPSQVDESVAEGLPPAQHVEALARRKVGAVALELEDAVVLGADTVVVLDGAAIGKPADAGAALATLLALNGRCHEVLTAVAVMDTASGVLEVGSERTTVAFRQLPRESLEAYVATGEPMGKAGAYAIQGMGAALVRSIEGDYFNVVGLPLALTLEMLARFGVGPLA